MAISQDGWIAYKYNPYTGIDEGSVNLLDGNDIVRGFFLGIRNEGGTIDLGSGDDEITGYDGFYNSGIIRGGMGADIIQGIGSGQFSKGLTNISYIDGGPGRDKIIGVGWSLGIENSKVIDGGNGDDIINGESTNGGLGIQNWARIYGGDGNDLITGKGANGIYNSGEIWLGNGNDVVKGIGGIGCDRVIDGGDGNDTVEASGECGLYGNGIINLGPGNDSLIGFPTKYNGSGLRLIGGRGTDSIRLPDGKYSISSKKGGQSMLNWGSYKVAYNTQGWVANNGIHSITVSEFELIGGVGGGLFGLKEGTFKVANGIGSY